MCRKGQDYTFCYSDSDQGAFTLVEKVDGRILSTDCAGGFVDTYIGLYASSNGNSSSNHADFGWLKYTQMIKKCFT